MNRQLQAVILQLLTMWFDMVWYYTGPIPTQYHHVCLTVLLRFWSHMSWPHVLATVLLRFPPIQSSNEEWCLFCLTRYTCQTRVSYKNCKMKISTVPRVIGWCCNYCSIQYVVHERIFYTNCCLLCLFLLWVWAYHKLHPWEVSANSHFNYWWITLKRLFPLFLYLRLTSDDGVYL
jgi:hypothetical protein